MSSKSNVQNTEWFDNSIAFLATCLGPFREVYYGLRSNTMPWADCLFFSAIICLGLIEHWDRLFFRRLSIATLYPVRPAFYWIYSHLFIVSPVWLWGMCQVALKKRLSKNLTEAFLTVGLKNALGRFPGYIFDRAIDDYTRRLRLSNAGLSSQDFENVRPRLQAILRIYIDEISESLDRGTVDMVYSHYPMPKMTRLDNIKEIPRWNFVVGKTRARLITVSLLKVPHLLIAGQTGGGKSTFLGQFITTLYTNNPDCEFTLIDLKGGMELSLFAGLPRIKVLENVEKAINQLSLFNKKLEQRMAILRENGCKDLESFQSIPREKRKWLANVPKAECSLRHVIVIDEAAEMFLAGLHAQAKDIMAARQILSQIARQGRSVGIHLVVATQRPDTKSLDPQVKANLTGVICFQMVNDASSISVLGTGRATELPAIPGRAIWKCGSETVEVQIPFLTDTEINALLRPESPSE